MRFLQGKNLQVYIFEELEQQLEAEGLLSICLYCERPV